MFLKFSFISALCVSLDPKSKHSRHLAYNIRSRPIIYSEFVKSHPADNKALTNVIKVVSIAFPCALCNVYVLNFV